MKNRILISMMVLLLLFAMAATASAVSVTRDLPDDPVAAGAEFEVSISQTDFFAVGTVTDVLPQGYIYITGSATDVDKAVYTYSTRTLVLTIDSETSTVTYGVTAGTANGTFVGTYATIDANANPMLGDVTGEHMVIITTLRGDVNHDGAITPTDVVIALTIAASGGENYNADIDGDGAVTSLDGLMILQASAGNIKI